MYILAPPSQQQAPAPQDPLGGALGSILGGVLGKSQQAPQSQQPSHGLGDSLLSAAFDSLSKRVSTKVRKSIEKRAAQKTS